MAEFGVVEHIDGAIGIIACFVRDERKSTQSIGVLVASQVEAFDATDLTEHVAQLLLQIGHILGQVGHATRAIVVATLAHCKIGNQLMNRCEW